MVDFFAFFALRRKRDMRPEKGDLQLLRGHNRGLIVRLLRTRGPMSRTQLSRMSGLAPSGLTRLVRDLLDEGLIEELGKCRSHGGRRAVLLGFNPSYAYTIGIKVERQRIRAAQVNLEGTILERRDTALPDSLSPEAVFDRIVETVASLRRGRVLGVGVGISGLVDSSRGVDLYSPILAWRHVEVARPLGRRLGLRTWVENDVNTLTLAERLYGAGRPFKHFVCLTVGEGIGAGVVLQGELYHGAFGGAGELGHMTMDPQGPLCRCGARGCLEVYTSDGYLESQARKLRFADIAHLAAAARDGSDDARRTFAEMGRSLGQGAKNAVNLLNPEAIVLGGERMEDADLFMASFEHEVRQNAFPEEARELKILHAELGPDGFLVGAAALATENFLRLPLESP